MPPTVSKQERLSTRHFAEELASRLIKEGFIVHFYQAMTSSSIYMKLDYGASYSIRISNHKGIPKYDYRYNLMMGMSPAKTKKFANSLPAPKYPRMFFSQYDVDLMVQAIILSRKELDKSHLFTYQERFDQYKTQFQIDSRIKRRGFAAQCHRIYK